MPPLVFSCAIICFEIFTIFSIIFHCSNKNAKKSGRCGCKKKKEKIDSAQKHEGNYMNLVPTVDVVELKPDAKKEQQIREGKLHANQKDDHYRTVADMGNLKSLVESDDQEKKKPVETKPPVVTTGTDKAADEKPKEQEPKKSKSRKSVKKSEKETKEKQPEVQNSQAKTKAKDKADEKAKEIEKVHWEVRENKEKKQKIDDGLIAAPKDPQYMTANFLTSETLKHDEDEKKRDIEKAKKLEKIKEGATVPTKDPCYATFQHDLPDLEKD